MALKEEPMRGNRGCGARVARFSRTLLCLSLAAICTVAFAQSPGKGSEPKKDVPAASAGDVARGKVTYQRNCTICHHAASTAKKIGPGLKGIYKVGKFADGKPVSDETMRVWIEDGGKDMPQFKNTLKPAQLADLIAYMKTL